MKIKLVVLIILTSFLFSCADQSSQDSNSGSDATTDIVQASGFNSLITITDDVEFCEAGGKRIDTGLDNGDGEGIANDGILQESEIDSTEYICNGVDGDNGKDGESGSDGIDGQDGSDSTTDQTPDIATVYNLSGKFQKGRCLKDSEVLIWPLIDGTLTQTGAHFIGFTGENGTYNIRAEMEENYALACFKGRCDDEANGGTSYQELCGIRKTSDLYSNINPLTKIVKPIAESLFDGGFGNVEQSIKEAERLTLAYLSMPVTSERFSTMSLEKDSTNDAALLLTSSMIIYNRTESEQRDYMGSIAAGVIEGDQILKAEILQDYDELPLITIKKNLETSYSGAGVKIDTPPFWRLKAPAYYADLLERDPIVTGLFNLDDNTTCSFDQSTYNMFAIPIVFDSPIEISKYVAFNFPPDAEISIWTKGIHVDGYVSPDVNVLNITGLREIILDNPVKLSYNGMLGEDHGLTAGTEYYIRIRKDENFTLSTGCDGGFLPFGRKLASNDEGLTWLGGDNNSLWFRLSGVVGILYH